MSLDDKKLHDKFIKKSDLPFTLLNDEEAVAPKAYGCYKEKKWHRQRYWGNPKNEYFRKSTRPAS